jgi:hypothetical protein
MTPASKLKRSIELPDNWTKNRFTIEQARHPRPSARRPARGDADF